MNLAQYSMIHLLCAITVSHICANPTHKHIFVHSICVCVASCVVVKQDMYSNLLLLTLTCSSHRLHP